MQSPPLKLLEWLTYTGKLTNKLYEKSKNTKLQVLKHEIQPSNWWDRHVLHLDFELVLHREIVTYAWNDACWYARTIIPELTNDKYNKLFNRLKRESLGDLIFGDNGIERRYLIYYPINKYNIEYNWLTNNLTQKRDTLWVRLSEFRLQENGTTTFVAQAERGVSQAPLKMDYGASNNGKELGIHPPVRRNNYFYLLEILLPGLEKYFC